MGLDWIVRRPKKSLGSTRSAVAAAPRYLTRLQAKKLGAAQAHTTTEQTTATTDTKRDSDQDKDKDDDEDEYVANERIGSYSSVHALRRAWIDAAQAWLAGAGGPSAAANIAEAARTLRQWLQPPTLWQQTMAGLTADPMVRAALAMGMPVASMMAPEGINYALIPDRTDAPEIKALRDCGLQGLQLMVKHSDCDGQYSPGEAADILRTYELIQTHLASDKREWSESSVVPVLRASVEHQMPVEFC